MADVQLRGVKKDYPGGFRAIHGIDMHISDGEFIVIVGPSGCGKSTLMRMVAGLERVTEGDILIGERVVNEVEPADRNIAMVFQNYALYPHMTVFNNMAYGLRNRRTPKDEIEKRVAAAAEILELQGLLDRRPRQLSGGQRQRVAMGRAIVREPSVFLFDEPLSNLDAKLRVQMRLEIRKLHQKLGVTSVYVTHDQVEAMTLADRLVVMNAGIAEQIGTPMEVYRRPASTYVAGFIGSPAMNFISARLGPGGTDVELPAGGRLPLSNGAFASQAGRQITLGIRPEHLTVANVGEGVVELNAEMIEQLGADLLVHGQFGHDQTNVTLRMPGSTSVAAGEVLHLSAEPESLHLFDGESGKRLAAD